MICYLARGDLMVRRIEGDAQGATAAPREAVCSRAELASSLRGGRLARAGTDAMGAER